MRTSIELITPNIARELLSGNTGNRKLREGVVKDYARQMKEGKWQESHQGIAIAPNGRVLDGQHRLEAIVASGVSIRMNVSRDVPEETFVVIDGGIQRTVADRLFLLNDRESNRIAVAVVTARLRIANEFSNRPSPDQVDLEFLDKTDAYVWMTELLRQNGKRRGLTRVTLATAMAMYVHTDPEKGKIFASSFFSGEGLNAGDPAFVLREAVIAERVKSEHEQYWKTVSACTAHQEGRVLHTLQAASKDMTGLVYKRLFHERMAAHKRGAAVRNGKKAAGTNA